ISHPERIRLAMDVLRAPNVMCVRGSYSRVSAPGGQVFAVNGLIQKPGLITLGVARQVFEDVGYFNCTTKASDDEFFNRVRNYYENSKEKIITLDVPL